MAVHILNLLQQFGAPEEYLTHLSQNNELFVCGQSLQGLFQQRGFHGVREFVQHVSFETTGQVSPLGMVVQSSQLQGMADRAKLPMDEVLSKLQSVFDGPLIFMLKRKDMVAQAVSHYFMADTGVGHSYQSSIGNPETYYEIRYDVKKLLKWYLFTRDSYALWDEIFQKNNISPIHIYYEDMIEDLYSGPQF